jgi:beta-mannanase
VRRSAGKHQQPRPHRDSRFPVKSWSRLLAVMLVLALTPSSMAVAGIFDDPQGSSDHAGWQAVDDAYTVSSRPNRTTGGSHKVAIGFDGWARKAGYVKFDVPTVGDDANPELVLTVIGGEAGTLEVHTTDVAWTEDTLTANTAPEPGPLVATVGVAGGSETLTVDLGDHVTTSGEYAFALVRQEDTGVTRIASRQHATSPGPILRTTGASTPTPTPAPSTTPIPTPTTATPTTATPSPPPSPTTTTSTPPPPPAAPGPCTVTKKLVPSCGAWFGVGAVPLGSESYEQAMLDFESTIGRSVDIAHYYQRGQEVLFPTGGQMARANEPNRNRILFYNWRPTITWRQVANGAADGYLSRLGRHMAATHPDPFFLSLHAEMESEVVPTAGSGQTAADFRDFFRHTVQVLRANGATQVVTVVNYMGAPHWGDQPWFEALYPGNDVVDWIAQDPYAFGPPPIWGSDFAGMVDRVQNPPGSTWPGFYTWATTKYPDKPMMIAEWGVDESDADPDYKPGFFDTAIEQLNDHPAIKGLVYWNAPEFHTVGLTRVDSSPASLEAFRRFAADPVLNQAGNYYLD